MSYVLAFLGFAALIILHEGGHFVAAKAVGMRVERFSLFFGPLILKRRIGETEYGIGVIPLGGYVKITGMNPSEAIPPEAVPRAYYNQAVWRRIVTIAAGPAVNILIAFIIVWAVLLNTGVQNAQLTRTVGGVLKGTPAAAALHPGDRLVSINGQSSTIDALRRQIEADRCPGTPTNGCQGTPLRIVVERGGHDVTVTTAPRYVAADGRMELGFDFGERLYTTPLSFLSAGGHSASYMWYVTSQTVSTVARIFEPQQRKKLNSVVGVYEVTQQSFNIGADAALNIIALISLSLGVINLFPFLPLDGGHIFWAVAEKIRGKRIPFVIMERAGVVGFALILLLFAIGLSNDISTLTGPGFNLGR
jgi:regulator of sigma E protease